MFGEFDNEDGIFGGKTDEHNESDLGEDVIVLAAQPDATDGGEQAHRNNEDDGHGHAPAFVLGGEDQEDEDDAEGKDVEEGVACEDLLISEVGPFDGEAAGEVLFGKTLDFFDHLAGGDAGQGVAVDVGGVIQVVALDAVGAAGFDDFHEGTERDHVTVLIADFDAGNVGGVLAELGVGLSGDLIGATKEVEVVDVGGAEVDLEGFVEIGERDAHGFGLGAIDFEFVLWGAGAEAGD